MMLLGNNLFEAFKEDVTEAIIPVSVYADTFRRKFIDTSGKMVFRSGKLVMKVPIADFVRLQLDRLFVRLQVGLPQLWKKILIGIKKIRRLSKGSVRSVVRIG